MSTTSDHGFVSQFLANRSWLVELLLAAVLMDLGVHLLAAAVPPLAQLSHWFVLIMGILFLIGSVFLLSRRNFKSRHYVRRIDGFITFSRSSLQLVPVRRYYFSEQVVSYLEAAFIENSALETLWKQSSLAKQFDVNEDSGKMTRAVLPANLLLLEASEYYLLSRLSLTLTDYFNRVPNSEDFTISLSRKDVPDVLLENRIFELLSRPMDQRPAFVKNASQPNASKIVMSVQGKGARYEKFDLILPRRASIQRLGPGNVTITTELFSLNLRILFGGTNTVVSPKFEEVYMGESKRNDFMQFQIGVRLEVKFRLRSMISIKSWRFHKWLDVLLDRIDADLSKDRFFRDINWESVETMLICQKQMERASNPSVKSDQEHISDSKN